MNSYLPGLSADFLTKGFAGEEMAAAGDVVLLPGDVPLSLIRVPAGACEIGSPDTERSRVADEAPVHQVTFPADLQMGKFTLTQRQWLAVMGSWPANQPEPEHGAGDDYPAYWVAWNDLQGFFAALNAHIAATGQGPATFRLPSETEWEYACRAGTTTRYYFGDCLTGDDEATDGPADGLPGKRSDYMWYSYNGHGDEHGALGAKPVGLKRPNQLGLYDMSGNMWEWVQDWYHPNYEGAPADGTAWDDAPVKYRVCRGGDWHYNFDSGRSANRGYGNPNSRYYYIGFRLVRTAG